MSAPAEPPARRFRAPPRARWKPLGMNHAPAFDALWSYRRRAPTDLNVVKAARAAMVWRSADGSTRRGILLLYLRWLHRFPRHLAVEFLRNGGAARRRFGRSRLGQISDMLRIAAVNGVQPRDYYLASLARLGGAPALFDYIHRDPIATVVTRLSSPADIAIVEQKLLFEERCRAAGLPVPRTLVVAEPDGLFLPSGEPFEGPFPARDLFVKPGTGTRGERAEMWCHRGAGHSVGTTGAVQDRDALAARARALAEETGSPTLIQERLANHPALEAFAGTALATTRILTAIDARGEPEIVDAFYRTSTRAGVAVDNFKAGGTIFPIELATGRFRPGMRDGVFDPDGILDHPETGCRIAGLAHPAWAEMAALALRFHRLFPGLLMPGWDVGWTGNGLVVTEGNYATDLSLNRQGTMGGAVRSRLFRILAHHARRWLEENEPEGSRWRFGAERR